jgi:hypothetical protein
LGREIGVNSIGFLKLALRVHTLARRHRVFLTGSRFSAGGRPQLLLRFSAQLFGLLSSRSTSPGRSPDHEEEQRQCNDRAANQCHPNPEIHCSSSFPASSNTKTGQRWQPSMQVGS